MNVADLPDDSDSSDEDYVPDGKTEDIPSEIDSDGDSEEPLSDPEQISKSRSQKRKKKSTRTKKKLKVNDSKGKVKDKNEIKQEEEKNVDDIWADFMKDTGFRPKSSKSGISDIKPKTSETNKRDCDTNGSNCSKISSSQKSEKKIKITQIFEFAGEEVKVEKEVDANTAEGRLLNKVKTEAPRTSRTRRTGGLSGIGNVLSQLGKKQKISTLEKSKLDWDRFKKEENIEEELQIHNRGKDGYLERQDFLQRADLRRFEIEKDIRNIERNKRFNI